MSTLSSEKYHLFLECSSSNERLGLLRDILTQGYAQFGGIDNIYEINNRPMWIFFVENKYWECVSEILLSQEDIDDDIQKKDENDQGWLHHMIINKAPDILTIEGLGKINKDWFYYNKSQQTPLHLMPSSKITQKIVTRLWSENPNLKSSYVNLFEEIIKMAQEKKRYDIIRVLRFWR